MITKEKIARINDLAIKAKTDVGLTEEEIQERDALKKEYVAEMKERVRDQLKRVKFVEDLSPEERADYEKNLKS